MNDSKKVIIDLDEYLMLTEQAKKITDVVQELAKHTSVEREYGRDPLDPFVEYTEYREWIKVDVKALKKFFNTMMDKDDLEVVVK